MVKKIVTPGCCGLVPDCCVSDVATKGIVSVVDLTSSWIDDDGGLTLGVETFITCETVMFFFFGQAIRGVINVEDAKSFLFIYFFDEIAVTVVGIGGCMS